MSEALSEGVTSTTNKPHQGRVALVTGASRGIGQAVAVHLARRGAHVAIGARSDQNETVRLVAEAGGVASALALDISDPASVQEARAHVEAELGQVDILVNNAATFETATWDALDLDLWQRVMSVNLNGTMLMCKAFLPLMRGRAWGRVINIASASVAIPSPVSIAYRVSKMGVIGLTRALSATLGDDGITINAVVASLTHTAMSQDVPEAIMRDSVGRQVIHRMAEPDDIAGAVIMVASDEASWVTGQTILANAGNAFSV
jgi:3-oxoacyl-[acyl-carrier protein] reductase